MDYLTPIKIKEYKGEPVTIAHAKLDGYYTEVYKDSIVGVHVYFKGRKKNLWPKLREIKHIYDSIMSLPDQTILRCELHAPCYAATSVPTLINDASKNLLLSPFCIELYAGKVKPFGTFEAMTICLIVHKFVMPKIKRLSNRPASLSEESVHSLKELARFHGTEGWVLKDHPGGNSYKIKPQKTVDAFVVGYNISDSDSYGGGLKSVDIAVLKDGEEKVIASVGSGFEGEYRMSVDPKTLIGKVGEFKYQSLGAKGRLKFPRFLRWRDDEKSRSQCLADQLKGF